MIFLIFELKILKFEMKVLKLSFFKIDVQYMWNMHIILGKKKENILIRVTSGPCGPDQVVAEEKIQFHSLETGYIAPPPQTIKVVQNDSLDCIAGNFCCRGVHMVK